MRSEAHVFLLIMLRNRLRCPPPETEDSSPELTIFFGGMFWCLANGWALRNAHASNRISSCRVRLKCGAVWVRRCRRLTLCNEANAGLLGLERYASGVIRWEFGSIGSGAVIVHYITTRFVLLVGWKFVNQSGGVVHCSRKGRSQGRNRLPNLPRSSSTL